MEIMRNISKDRENFYSHEVFKNFINKDFEVVYTFEMDFNSSQLESATLLVARISTPSPPTTNMSLWVYNTWLSLFTTMLTIAIGGNAIVIWIVTAHRRMRTVTNYFLVNLSFADLMMASLNCLFNFIYMLNSDWIFGVRYCQISNFIANVTVAASVFTLTGISFDRYQAIARPMQPRMSKTCSLLIIAVIWISGMVLAIPCLMYSTTKEYRYQTLFFVVTYVIPMVGMTFFYTAIGRVLWGSGTIGELTQRQLDSIRLKRKVVKMFILVIVIFGICWLPYHSYFIYTHFDPDILYTNYVQHMYMGFYWLAMANAMVNPIIYYWMNAKFRMYFRTAMCWWSDAIRRRWERRYLESPPERASHSGNRSRSGLGELKDSSGSVEKGLRRSSQRGIDPRSASSKPSSHANCRKCPHTSNYDAYIHGCKV